MGRRACFYSDLVRGVANMLKTVLVAIQIPKLYKKYPTKEFVLLCLGILMALIRLINNLMGCCE